MLQCAMVTNGHQGGTLPIAEWVNGADSLLALRLISVDVMVQSQQE